MKEIKGKTGRGKKNEKSNTRKNRKQKSETKRGKKQKKRQKNRENRHRKTNTNMVNGLLTKVQEQYNREKTVFSSNGAVQSHSHIKNYLCPILHILYY